MERKIQMNSVSQIKGKIIIREACATEYTKMQKLKGIS